MTASVREDTMHDYRGTTRDRLFQMLYDSGDIAQRRAILSALAYSYGVRRITFTGAYGVAS